MWDLLGKFVQSASSVGGGGGGSGNKVVSLPSNKNIVGGGGGGSNPSNVSWDPARSGGSIQLTEGNAHCFLKEQSYLFRTTVSNNGFTSGVHYWEILADSRT